MGMNLLSFSHNFFPSHHFFFFSHWSTVATEKKNQSLSKKVFFCKHFSPAAAHNYYLLLYPNVFSHICERHISVGDKICTPCHLLPSCPLLHCNEHEIRRMWGSHTLRNGPSSSKVVAVVEASPLSLLGTTGQGCLWQQGKARSPSPCLKLCSWKPPSLKPGTSRPLLRHTSLAISVYMAETQRGPCQVLNAAAIVKCALLRARHHGLKLRLKAFLGLGPVQPPRHS